MMPWVFSLDHIKYFRLGVHPYVCDVFPHHIQLYLSNFHLVHLLSRKPNNHFLGLFCMRGDGGGVRQTEIPNAVRMWMVVHPKIVHMIREFDDVTGISGQHHEQTCSIHVAVAREMLRFI